MSDCKRSFNSARHRRRGAHPARGSGAEGFAGRGEPVRPGVIVAGSEPPSMSVAFADPRGAFSGFSVIFSEIDPDPAPRAVMLSVD